MKKRDYRLDLLRVISMIMVVIIHIANYYCRAFNDIDKISYLGALIFNTISRISVPFFFMISGATLLNKKYDKEKNKERIIKKIITLICCVLFSMLLLTGCASQEVNLDDAQTQQVEDNVKSLISLIVVELPADASADADWTANAAYSEADREVQLNLSKDLWEELQTKWKKENNLRGRYEIGKKYL